jgi:predicted transcriptional regulator
MAEPSVGRKQKDSSHGEIVHLDPVFSATKGPTPTAVIVQIAVTEICPQASVVAAVEIMKK